MAPWESDRPRRTDPDEQQRQATGRRHAVALQVVTRFRGQPEVAREMLDMLGLVGSSEPVALEPGRAPDDRRIVVHWESR